MDYHVFMHVMDCSAHLIYIAPDSLNLDNLVAMSSGLSHGLVEVVVRGKLGDKIEGVGVRKAAIKGNNIGMIHKKINLNLSKNILFNFQSPYFLFI